MAKTCDTCGCPLGLADIEAAQCPVCRKTVWRHTVEHLADEKHASAEKPARAEKPVYSGTMIPPSLPEIEEEEFPKDLPPNEALQTVAADGDSAIDLSDVPAGENTEETLHDPALKEKDESSDADSGATLIVSSLDSLSEPDEVAPGSRTDRSGATATVDPRYFEKKDWEAFAQTLATGLPDEPRDPSPTTDFSGEGTVPRDSRYVGKTPVAPRNLARPGRVTPAAADYVLGNPLGAGGMGIVYQATQRSIDRAVALKMLKPEAARRRDRRDSLATEAIVTGELTHPNIVPIHDLGQDAAGNLFYSMKRVEGARWDDALPEKSQAENLEIFLKVADAIAFAHSRGVVHRDLKPENVLLGGFGEVLVMDWGLAYPTDRFRKHDSITANAAMGGSPAYMAPEQAVGFLISGGWRTGEIPPITPSIDIYLLGAILFEIAVGRPPHSGDSPALCVVAAAENRIREVNSTSGLLPIAWKAMQTDPSDRYATVEELQAAVREFRTHSESVLLAERAQSLLKSGDLARAVVGFEDALQLWPENPEATTQVVIAKRRLARRRYALTAMTAAFLLAIGVGGFGINHQRLAVLDANEDLTESIRQEKLATEAAKAAADRERNANEIAQTARKAAEAAETEQRLAKEDAQRARDAADDAAEQQRLAKEDAQRAQSAAEIARNDAERERERQRYQNYQGRIKLIDARIGENAFAEADRLLGQLAEESPDLCGWEWGRLKYLCTQGRRTLDVTSPVTAAATAPDGSFAVTGGADGRIRFLSLATDEAPAEGLHREFPDAGLGRITALAVSPDSRLIAAAGTESPEIVLFRTAVSDDEASTRLATGHSRGRLPLSLSFSADGSRLLSAGTGGLIVWDVASGRKLVHGGGTDGDPLPLTCAAMSPDGQAVAAGLADGQVLVWRDASTSLSPSEAGVFDGHRRGAEFGDGFQYAAGEVTALAFLYDGRTVVSGGDDGRLLRWNVRDVGLRNDAKELAGALASAVAATRGLGAVSSVPEAEVAAVAAHTGPVRAVSARATNDGRTQVVTGGSDGLVKIWSDVEAWRPGLAELDPLTVLRGHEGAVTAVASIGSEDAALKTFSAGADATARIWDVGRYGEVHVVQTPVIADHEQEILAAAFDPTGRRMMTAGRDEALVVTDLADRGAEPRRSSKVHGEAISVPWVVPFSDGERLLTGYLDGSFAIWSVPGRTTLARVTPDIGSSLVPPTVSPDGRWIASSWRTASADRSIAVWSVNRLLAPGAAQETPDFVFEPRGEVFAATFTSDGRLVFGDRPGPKRPAGGYVYVANPGADSLETHRVFGDGVEGRVYAVESLPNGEILAAGSPSVGSAVRVVRLDPATGTERGTALELAGGFLSAMAASQDGRWLATLSNAGGDRAQSLEGWNLVAGTRAWEIRLTASRGTALDISPDGRSLLVVTEPVRRDGDGVVATGSSEARLLDPATGQERRFGPEGDEPLLSSTAIATRVSGAAFAANGRNVFLTAIRGVSEWSLERRSRVPGTFDSRGAITVSGFSADGRFVIGGHQDGSFEIRDANSPRLMPVFHEPAGERRDPITAAAFSPVAGSLRFLVSASKTVSLREFHPETRTVSILREPAIDATGFSVVRDVAFSADGRWNAAACDDGAARLWETDGDRPAIRLERAERPSEPAIGHVGAVTAVAFPRTAVPDGFQVVATAGIDRNVIVWVIDVRRAVVVAAVPLRGHRDEVTDLAFLPGRLGALASVSADGTAKLWDWDRSGIVKWEEAGLANLGEPEEVLTLRGPHTAGLTAVDVSPDGLTILTAGRDGRAVLWPAVPSPRTITP